MPFFDDIQFFIAFTRASIPLQFNAFKFFFFSAVHALIGTDPAAKDTFPSLVSLPLGMFDKRAGRSGSTCPYASSEQKDREYRAPLEGDSRSPCPALNTMANHGYIPRDGRNLTGSILTNALIECYNLSYPLAAFLAWGGVLLLGQVGMLELSDLARHNRIEHNASITHDDTAPLGEYAPIPSHHKLMETFLASARKVEDAREGVFGTDEIAKVRVRREGEAGVVTAVQQEIARGEVALVISIFGGEKFEVPIEVIRSWWKEERLPKGWQPTRKTTLLGTIGWSTALRHTMQAIRDGTWTPNHHETLLERIQQTTAYRHVVDLLKSAIAEVTHREETPEEPQIIEEELATAKELMVIEDKNRAIVAEDRDNLMTASMLRRKEHTAPSHQNGNDEDHKILEYMPTRHNSIPVAITA